MKRIDLWKLFSKSAGSNPGTDKFHFHIRCFAAWEFERRGDGGGAPHR
jgi:hypothetical protein